MKKNKNERIANFNINSIANHKVLILSDIPPCRNYTGGIMLSQLMRFLLEEKINVHCFCVMNDMLNPEFDQTIMSDISFVKHSRPQENFRTSDVSHKKYYSLIKKLIKSFYNYINDNDITKILCVIQGEVIVELVNSLKKINNIEYVVQIWDPIEWWIKVHEFDHERREKVLNGYANAISNASYCITTSYEMSKAYSRKYGTKCIEVMPPLEKRNYTIDSMEKNNKEFVIAISGQIYAKEETDALLQALTKINWEHNGKQIVFKYYGTWSDEYIDLQRYDKYKNRIKIQDFLPQNKLLEELIYADLLYCPYFFSNDEVLKKVSSLSFPSKLVTYMSLNVPTLLHAPNYASPYLFLKEVNAAYLVDTMDIDEIAIKIKEIVSAKEKDISVMTHNAARIFSDNFSFEKAKDNLFKALNLKYKKIKKLRILEVNNVDLSGRRFNGFDLQRMINKETVHSAKQIVTYKTSNDKNVASFYDTNRALETEQNLINNEMKVLSVHSQLSFTSNILYNHDYYIHSDVVHYHLIHNTKLSLSKLIDLCKTKPSVLTIHDPWNFTGRCVYPQECQKWKTGCKNCENLDNLFPLKEDNCNSLWKLKEKVYKKIDVDIVVSTPFMLNMIKNSPLTKHFNNIHVIPFGIDLVKFSNNISKKEARKKLKINQDDIVLFFRAQMAMKGTEYIIEALKELKTDKHITLLTCSEKGLLKELKNKYTIIDLGHIEDDDMIVSYNACDIFLMPSRGESFGLMAIEAMACSRPIVIFDNSALPYVTFAPECGVLVENKNSKALMKAIKHLIEDENERISRGKLGRKLAEENYDINLYHQRIMKLYEDVYERQKNKEILYNRIKEIDYSSLDVQILIRKLEKILHNIFGNFEFNVPFLKHKRKTKKIDTSAKIDYSLDSVQHVIAQFNDYVYELLQIGDRLEFEKLRIKNLNIFKKVLYYYKNDWSQLKKAIKYRIRKYPIIFKPLKLVYFLLNDRARLKKSIRHRISNIQRKTKQKRK